MQDSEVTLKKRIHQQETISVASGSTGMSREKLCELSAAGHDLIFIDGQHRPIDEKELAGFCKAAAEAGLPVVLRIRHPDEAFLAGRYLDFGPIGIVVPMVEREETVLRAVESFYYPPIGRRSWGPGNAYGWGQFAKGFPYAEWWNSHGILMIQFESLPAILGAEKLIKPGVDMVVFGECDLTLDLSARADAPFKTFEECRNHVVKETQGMDVKIGASNSPLGKL
ncbi:MAG: aldolase/citrate lyase family protein [Planctomycetota bacterium]